MDDDFKDRARLRRAQMEKRLEMLIAGPLTSSSGNIPLLPIDREPDFSGNTMLHLCGLLGSDAAEAAKRLVDVVPIQHRNAHGETCFHTACRAGNTAVLSELLRGANRMLSSTQVSQLLNTREWRCRMYTALHFAVMANAFSCVDLMLSCGADAGLLDSGGVSAAVIAANNGNDQLLALLSREWYAAEVWRPALHYKFPLVFKNEVFLLLLALKRVSGGSSHQIYYYRDVRWLIIMQLAKLYKLQRLRRGLMNSRDRIFG